VIEDADLNGASANREKAAGAQRKDYAIIETQGGQENGQEDQHGRLRATIDPRG